MCGTAAYGFAYDEVHYCFSVVVVWEVIRDYVFSHSCLSYMTSTTKVWSQPMVFAHGIESLKSRSIYRNGKFFWLGHGMGMDYDGIEGYYTLCYDTNSNLISRELLSFPHDGTLEDIIIVDDKIAAINRVPDIELNSTFLRLWISGSELSPRSDMVLLEKYNYVPEVYNFVGSIGSILFSAPEYCIGRGSKRDMLCLFGGDFVLVRRIDGSSPRRFYINYVAEHYHTLYMF